MGHSVSRVATQLYLYITFIIFMLGIFYIFIDYYSYFYCCMVYMELVKDVSSLFLIPIFFQFVSERIQRWNIDNILCEVIPIINTSAIKKVMSKAQSANWAFLFKVISSCYSFTLRYSL